MGRFKKNSPGCKCCGVPPCNCTSIITTDCGSSTPDVFYYTFTISGLTNDDCTSCSIWNGDFKLCWAGSDTWNSETSSSTACSHVAGDPLYKLTRTGGYYYLKANGPGYPQWRLATGSWQCAKPNTLNLVTPTPVPAACGNVPATVLLTPCYTCNTCNPAGSFPSRVQVDLTGVVNALCTGMGGVFDCDSVLNATFVLNRVSNQCVCTKSTQVRAMFCYFPGQPTSWNLSHYASVSLVSNYRWTYRMQLFNANAQLKNIEFIYTSASKFDCSVARTLTFVSQDLNFCDFSGATVTLTPL